MLYLMEGIYVDLIRMLLKVFVPCYFVISLRLAVIIVAIIQK